MGILTVCLGLVAGIHARLNHDSVQLRLDRNEVYLRSALQAGLREGMKHLSRDEVSAYDDARESWGAPLLFQTSDGVDLTVQIEDAQNRFDLNSLSLPVTPDTLRTPEQMLAELLRLTDQQNASELAELVTRRISEEDVLLMDAQQLMAVLPEHPEVVLKLFPHVMTLPRPETRPLPVNLNSVQPEVLLAITGPQVAGWVTSVLSQRDVSPIPSVSSATSGLPPLVQEALARVVDVRSDFFLIRVTAEVDHIEKRTNTLVFRGDGGSVEVVSCHW